MAYRSLTFFLPHWWAIPLIIKYNRHQEASLRENMLTELRRKNLLNDIKYIPYIYKASMHYPRRSIDHTTHLAQHTYIADLCRDIQFLKKIYKPKKSDNGDIELVRRD